jgi:hypothetical protein
MISVRFLTEAASFTHSTEEKYWKYFASSGKM